MIGEQVGARDGDSIHVQRVSNGHANGWCNDIDNSEHRSQLGREQGNCMLYRVRVVNTYNQILCDIMQCL